MIDGRFRMFRSSQGRPCRSESLLKEAAIPKRNRFSRTNLVVLLAMAALVFMACPSWRDPRTVTIRFDVYAADTIRPKISDFGNDMMIAPKPGNEEHPRGALQESYGLSPQPDSVYYSYYDLRDYLWLNDDDGGTPKPNYCFIAELWRFSNPIALAWTDITTANPTTDDRCPSAIFAKNIDNRCDAWDASHPYFPADRKGAYTFAMKHELGHQFSLASPDCHEYSQYGEHCNIPGSAMYDYGDAFPFDNPPIDRPFKPCPQCDHNLGFNIP